MKMLSGNWRPFCLSLNVLRSDNILARSRWQVITWRLWSRSTWQDPLHSMVFLKHASMMTSSNGNILRVTGHLCGEFTGHRWISPHKGQWCGALMLSLICPWIKVWVNNGEAGDLRRNHTHYKVTVMRYWILFQYEDDLPSYQDSHYKDETGNTASLHYCIVLFHRHFSPSGEQPKQHILAHKSEQPTRGV